TRATIHTTTNPTALPAHFAKASSTGRKDMSAFEMGRIAGAARGSNARESRARDVRDVIVRGQIALRAAHHRHATRHVTCPKATFATMFLKASSLRLKMMVVNEVWPIFKYESGARKWRFVAASRDGVVTDGALMTPKLPAGGPLMIDRQGVRMTEPTPA